MDCDGNRCIFWTLTKKMFVFIGTKKAYKYFGTVLSILYINYICMCIICCYCNGSIWLVKALVASLIMQSELKAQFHSRFGLLTLTLWPARARVHKS